MNDTFSFLQAQKEMLRTGYGVPAITRFGHSGVGC